MYTSELSTQSTSSPHMPILPTEHPIPPTLTTLHLSPSTTITDKKPRLNHTTAITPSTPQTQTPTPQTKSSTQPPNPWRSIRKNTPKERLGPFKECSPGENTTLRPDEEKGTYTGLPPPLTPPAPSPAPSRPPHPSQNASRTPHPHPHPPPPRHPFPTEEPLTHMHHIYPTTNADEAMNKPKTPLAEIAVSARKVRHETFAPMRLPRDNGCDGMRMMGGMQQTLQKTSRARDTSTSESASTNASTEKPLNGKNNSNKNRDKSESEGGESRRKYSAILDLYMIRQDKRQNVGIRDFGSSDPREKIEGEMFGAGSGSEGDVSGEGEDDEKGEDVSVDKGSKNQGDEERQEGKDDEASGDGKGKGEEKGEKDIAESNRQEKCGTGVGNKDERMEDQECREESDDAGRSETSGTVQDEIDWCEDNDDGENKKVEKMCEERRNLTKRRRIC